MLLGDDKVMTESALQYSHTTFDISKSTQAFRSEKVRSVARDLAKLEPGKTPASKMAMAMRFEEHVFKAESSLDGYEKTIQKRIKKLQKHYAKEQQNGTPEKNEDLQRERELLMESELRDEYGPRLLYIAEHADEAVKITRQKGGDQRAKEKADLLQKHAQNSKQWAVQLGLELPPNCSGGPFHRERVRNMEYLNKLKGYLSSRVDNIHSHVVKAVEPDLFLAETIGRMDDILLKEKVSEVLRKALIDADKDKPDFSPANLRQLVDNMNATVPNPGRNRADQLRSATMRIEKIRAATQAMYVYMGLSGSDKAQFKGLLGQCHGVVIACLKDLDEEYKELVTEVDELDENGKRLIKLEDAWNNPMQVLESESLDDDPDGSNEPEAKRQRIGEGDDSLPTIMRTQYLLTPGRHIFSTLLPVLKQKRAVLTSIPTSSTVKLVFGKAFVMSIFFVPLLVTIRAIDDDEDESATVSNLTGGLRWPSLYQGISSQNNVNGEERRLSVFGVTGSVETLGPIVARRLEYASAQATFVLRRCFSEAFRKSKPKTEFEVEILEASALIKFLQAARANYCQDWVDDDS